MAKRRSVVAIIDDDAGMRSALEQLMSANGYATELFSSADSFLEAAATSKADCLVIDIQLGTVSGVELRRQLLAIGFKFPVIFMTGSDDNSIRAEAMKFGCIAYLYKPFPTHRLIAAIKKAIGSDPSI
jgi:FixJ family two-component response regulator